MSPALQVNSLPSKPPGKPKNTRVGSLSLLQGIFPTQKSNRGLLHCERILYQQSYQGSPIRSCSVQFSSIQLLSRVQLFATPWTAAHQASLSITNSRSLLKLMSIESVMPSTISSSVIPFSSCLPSFLASGSFPMSQLFTSGGQSIGASASASGLPMNIQN